MKTCALQGVTLAPEEGQRWGGGAGKACSEKTRLTHLYVLQSYCLIDATLCFEVKTHRNVELLYMSALSEMMNLQKLLF